MSEWFSIARMMQQEADCKWRKDGLCTHPIGSMDDNDCPWKEPTKSLQDWYPCMFAEAEQ